MPDETTRPSHDANADRAALDTVLDAALLAHVGLVVRARAQVVAVPFARDADRILIRVPADAGWARTLPGADASVLVSQVDALVAGHSPATSSLRYRSALLTGRFALLEAAGKDAALNVLAASMIPGRAGELHPSGVRELGRVEVLQMPIRDWSMSTSNPGPAEDGPDPAWAGVVPRRVVFEAPIADPVAGPEAAVPPSVLALVTLAAAGDAPVVPLATVRPAVARVAAQAPLPLEAAITTARLTELEQAVAKLPDPLTVREAEALIELFEMRKAETYSGVMWSIVRAVESAEKVPPAVWTRSGPWFDALRMRATVAGLRPPIRKFGRWFKASSDGGD